MIYSIATAGQWIDGHGWQAEAAAGMVITRVRSNTVFAAQTDLWRTSSHLSLSLCCWYLTTGLCSVPRWLSLIGFVTLAHFHAVRGSVSPSVRRTLPRYVAGWSLFNCDPGGDPIRQGHVVSRRIATARAQTERLKAESHNAQMSEPGPAWIEFIQLDCSDETWRNVVYLWTEWNQYVAFNSRRCFW